MTCAERNAFLLKKLSEEKRNRSFDIIRQKARMNNFLIDEIQQPLRDIGTYLSFDGIEDDIIEQRVDMALLAIETFLKKRMLV